MIKGKKKKKKGVKRFIDPRKKILSKEQWDQINEISTLLKNIGFTNILGIDGKEIVYLGRTTEMDDIYCHENIILIAEYTIGDPGTHLLRKKIFYDKILENKRSFLEFLIHEPQLKSFAKYYSEKIEGKYSFNEIQIRILYCSKKSISSEHKGLVEGITFFDYHIVKYFLLLSKVIKKSSCYEFFDFLEIPFKKVGENIKNSSLDSSMKFSGHILPEEKSSFKDGYKIVSFYIDAESLLKRAFVLRKDGWRDIEGVGHYQRMLDKKKIASMRKYLTEKNRVFINNIITSIATDKIKLFDKECNELILQEDGQFKGSDSSEVMPAYIEIKDECNIIGLIDGQHKTFAYYEGDDAYEKTIAVQRKIQNLLVTSIIFPSTENEEKRLKFQANLFTEINSNQTKAQPGLLQEIELIINPFSSITISKRILQGLNKSGPLGNLIEELWYEKDKIKTASIVSYGLRPLIKIEDIKAKDSIFSIWNEPDKNKLKAKDNDAYNLLKEYIDFSVEKIRDLLIAFKTNLTQDQWKTYSNTNTNGILTVTFINGVLNTLRLIIENNKVSTIDNYKTQLKGIGTYDFKKFKSSQYRKMGEDIYNNYFA